MSKNREKQLENMKSGLSSLINPTNTRSTRSAKADEAIEEEKPKYKSCNFVMDPSYHRRLKNYATDTGSTLIKELAAAIDLYLKDKGEKYQ